MRTGWAEGQLGTAGVLIGEENLLPGGAAVRRAEDAAVRLRRVGVAQGARKRDVGIVRIDDDASDAARLFEAHVFPRLSGVDGLVDAVADGDVAANERLAGAGPYDG